MLSPHAPGSKVVFLDASGRGMEEGEVLSYEDGIYRIETEDIAELFVYWDRVIWGGPLEEDEERDDDGS